MCTCASVLSGLLVETACRSRQAKLCVTVFILLDMWSQNHMARININSASHWKQRELERGYQSRDLTPPRALGGDSGSVVLARVSVPIYTSSVKVD